MTSANQDILAYLDQQQAQLNALLSLLQQELRALAERNIEQLTSLTEQKTTLLADISSTDQALAQAKGLAEVSLEPWFNDSVANLNELLAQCKQQTDVNQQVVEQSQLMLDRLKNEILAAKGKSGLTYTNKGKPAVDNKGSGIKA